MIRRDGAHGSTASRTPPTLCGMIGRAYVRADVAPAPTIAGPVRSPGDEPEHSRCRRRRASTTASVCHEGGDIFTFLQKRLPGRLAAARCARGEDGDSGSAEVHQLAPEGPDPRAAPLGDERGGGGARSRAALGGGVGRAGARICRAARSDARGGRPIRTRLRPAGDRCARSSLAWLDERCSRRGCWWQREKASEPRPRFRRRLMFPILDSIGRHIGFGGRAIGTRRAQVSRTRRSRTVFSKGKMLYGLNVGEATVSPRRAGDRRRGLLRRRAVDRRPDSNGWSPVGDGAHRAQAQMLTRLREERHSCCTTATEPGSRRPSGRATSCSARACRCTW